MHATRKVKLKDLTSNLTCNLCGGYFVDATTIIECLHSFCRSCIVQHLEKSEYCPVCEVQLHSSKPLTSIRSDQMLQEIVYKLVPGLFQNEMTKRRKFYGQHQNSVPINQLDSGQSNESYITSDDIIHLSLEYFTSDVKFRETTKRYVKCPAAVSISILKKLIQGKYDLNNSVQVDVMYGDRVLPDEFLLMDIAYKYSWSQNGSKPLQLSYRVKGNVCPNTKPAKQLSRYKSKIPAPVSNTSTPIPIRKSSQCIPRKKMNGTMRSNSLEMFSNGKTPVTSTTPNGLQASKRNSTPKSTSTDSGTVTPIFMNPSKHGASTKLGPRKRKLSIEGEQSIEMEISDNGIISIPPKEKQSKYENNNNNNNEPEMVVTNSSGAEVQLRISENGVISATSIASGEKKIIVNSNGPNNKKLRRTSNDINADEIKMKPFPSSNNNFPSQPPQQNTMSDDSHEEFLQKMNKLQQDLLLNGSQNLQRSKAHPEAKLKRKAAEQEQQKMSKVKTDRKSSSPGSKSKAKVQNSKTPDKKPSSCPIRLSMSSSKSPETKSLTYSKTNGTGSSSTNQVQTTTNQVEISEKQHQHQRSPILQPNKPKGPTHGLKRFQNIRVNGELKFSPIKTGNIGNGIEIIPINSPNKKPPKFFKSRVNANVNAVEIIRTNTSDSAGNNNVNANGIHSSETSLSSPLIKGTMGTSIVSSVTAVAGTNSSSSQSITIDKDQSQNPVTNLSSSIETSSCTNTAPIMVPIPSTYNSTQESPQVYRFPTLEQWPIGFAPNVTNGNNILVPFVTNNFCSMPFHTNPSQNNNGLNLSNAEILQHYQQQMQQQYQHRHQHSTTACSTTKVDPMSSIMSGAGIGTHFTTFSGVNPLVNQMNAHVLDPMIHGTHLYQLQQHFQNNGTLDLSAHNRKVPITCGDGGSSDMGNGKGNIIQRDNTKLQPASVKNASPAKKSKVSNVNGVTPPRLTKKKTSPLATPKKSKQEEPGKSVSSPSLASSKSPTTILQVPTVSVSPKKDLSSSPKKTSPSKKGHEALPIDNNMQLSSVVTVAVTQESESKGSERNENNNIIAANESSTETVENEGGFGSQAEVSVPDSSSSSRSPNKCLHSSVSIFTPSDSFQPSSSTNNDDTVCNTQEVFVEGAEITNQKEDVQISSSESSSSSVVADKSATETIPKSESKSTDQLSPGKLHNLPETSKDVKDCPTEVNPEGQVTICENYNDLSNDLVIVDNEEKPESESPEEPSTTSTSSTAVETTERGSMEDTASGSSEAVQPPSPGPSH